MFACGSTECLRDGATSKDGARFRRWVSGTRCLLFCCCFNDDAHDPPVLSEKRAFSLKNGVFGSLKGLFFLRFLQKVPVKIF